MVKRAAAAAVAAALSMAAGGGQATAAPAPIDQKLAQTLAAIDAAVDAQDCAKVVSLGEPLLTARRGTLPGDVEGLLDEFVGGCAYGTGAREKGYARVLEGTALPASPDSLWRMRLGMEIESRKLLPAFATVEAMAGRRPAALNTIPIRWLFDLSRGLKQAGRTAERKRLLAILSADSYAPLETAGDAQGFHFANASLLAEEGDVAGAKAMLASVTDPELLVDALFDPRLAPLLPAGLDLRAAAETEVAVQRTAAGQHPNRMEPILEASRYLRRLGRPQEALALVQPLLARADAATAFIDAGAKLPWAWDEAARANEALGRYEEAAKALTAGAALKESGTDNVSQIINLAHLQIRFGHPADALTTLAVFDDAKRRASPYGFMEMRLARGCANAALSRTDAVAADLAYEEAHAADHPDALGVLYLCLGRMDDAAAFFIRRLEDADNRARALRSLSDYDAAPVPIPARFGGKIEALQARADIRAALAKAGGIRRIPLQPTDL